MIKLIKLIFLFLSIIGLNSCNLSDNTQKLFGEYEFVTESSEDHFIIGGSNNIPPHVIEYKFDNGFLVAKQKPIINVLINEKANNLFNLYESGLPETDSLYLKFKMLGAKDNRHKNFEIAEIIAKEIILKRNLMYKKYLQNEFLYWILIRETDTLIGPLTKSEFDIAQKEYLIPKKLMFSM